MSIPQIWAYERWSFWTVSEVNGTEVGSNDTLYYLCVQRQDFNYNAIFYATLGLIFFALLLGFLFCYVSIIHFVKTHGNKFRRNEGEETTSIGTEGPGGSLQKNRHRRTIRLIMSLILIFFLCRTPVWIFLIIVQTTDVPTTRTTLSTMHILHLLSNLNTALSPFVYAIWNDALRAGGGKGGGDEGLTSCSHPPLNTRARPSESSSSGTGRGTSTTSLHTVASSHQIQPRSSS
jgi:hypothetical protein